MTVLAGTLTQPEPKTHRSRRLFVLPEAVRVALRAHRTREKIDGLAAVEGRSMDGREAGRGLMRSHDQ